MILSPLAGAMADAVESAPRRKVPLSALLAAAAAVDRTAATSVNWRPRIASAIDELARLQLVELPRTRWDASADPPLPSYVTRPASSARPTTQRETIVWHLDLAWVAELEATGKLRAAERRFLADVNTWLQRREGCQVAPQRERSLDVCGDEKALDRWVFTPLFGPGRLSYEMLRCRPCWPPVHQVVLGPGPWLVIENWTTYITLADAARDSGWKGRLIWGAGNQVGTRLTSLAATESRPSDLWYFGDIDTAGFGIARTASTRATSLGINQTRAARDLYRACFDAGVPRQTAKRAPDDLGLWTREWLGGDLGRRTAGFIAEGQRIVQETVGVEHLASMDVARLMPDVA